MDEVAYNERHIVSALQSGKLRLKAFLSPIEARRYAENLAAETRYDDGPRYERVKIIDMETCLVHDVIDYVGVVDDSNPLSLPA